MSVLQRCWRGSEFGQISGYSSGYWPAIEFFVRWRAGAVLSDVYISIAQTGLRQSGASCSQRNRLRNAAIKDDQTAVVSLRKYLLSMKTRSSDG